MYVVEGLRRLQSGLPLKSTAEHRDLWEEAESLVLQLADRLTINHVRAHEEADEALGPYEAWCIEWNAAADTAAGLANVNRPQVFQELHAKLCCDRKHQCSRLKALQAIHFGIASLTNQDRQTLQDWEEVEAEDEELPPPALEQMDGFSDSFAPNWRQAIKPLKGG